ncbi:hypothetical protein SDC9_99889 [bioreactor metagenome]|uniref:Uncharacterized protein n=1 Tax=bioreactor metagenome TaxID=1076179 RepID=A0A645AU72_9ZZZZ
MRRTDEHVGHKVSLPRHFHHKAHFHACIFVCTAESVNHVQFFSARELFCHQAFAIIECLGSARTIDGTVPPQRIFCNIIFNKEFIFWGATGKFSCVNSSCTGVGKFGFFESFVCRIHLVLIKNFVRWVMNDFEIACNPILA